MPTIRRKVPARRIAIPAAAIEPWRRGDYRALHRALGLAPCHMSPLPRTLTPLGCDADDPPPDQGTAATIFAQTWGRAVELQQALLEIAGEPGEQEDR